MRGAAARPLASRAPLAARIERAKLLAVLDRLDEAADSIRDSAGRDPSACLMLASVLQDGKQWDESSRCYRAALSLPVAAGGTLRRGHRSARRGHHAG